MTYFNERIRNSKTPDNSILSIDSFKGADLMNSPSNINISRSRNCINMIRDIPGKVRKRMGYSTESTFDARINGIFFYKKDNGESIKLIHSGTKLYNVSGEQNKVVYQNMNDEFSNAFQMDKKLFIQDGLKMYSYDGQNFIEASKDAYIPTVIISRTPTGGGTYLEPVNLLGTKWKESFLCDDSSKVYNLTAKGLDNTKVLAKKLKDDGTYEDLVEGEDFSVDRALGKITFNSPIGESPVTGRDNLEITASKVREGYAEKINNCTIMTVYGLNGNTDRLFVSGNSKFRNYDFYSGMNKPTYFGDTNYCILGQDNTDIIGYSILNEKLLTYKNGNNGDVNIYVRSGSIIDDSVVFSVENTLTGNGAISKKGFGNMENEPVFLTSTGVCAITTADISGEKYSINRSYFINNELTKHNLKNAVTVSYKDFFMIFIDGKVYLLDGLQKSYEKNAPYSTFQYECYVLDNIPARVAFTEDNELYFGTEDGEIMKFYTDEKDQESYNDNGKEIKAVWELPPVCGKYFYKNKVFKNIFIKLSSAVCTSVLLKRRLYGTEKYLYDSKAFACYFDFSYIDFGSINFSSDNSERCIPVKIRTEKTDKASFILENNRLNEPFGIFNIAIEFSEKNSNYRY